MQQSIGSAGAGQVVPDVAQLPGHIENTTMPTALQRMLTPTLPHLSSCSAEDAALPPHSAEDTTLPLCSFKYVHAE